VAEAAVQLFLKIQVVEGVDEVGPVEMGVDAEHLTEDHLANFDEVLGETAALAYPISVSLVRNLREWRGGD